MNPQPLSPLVASSTDSTQVGNTVKGLILGASSLIIFLAFRFFHLNFTAGDVSSLADEIGVTAGAIWFVFGLIHKLVAHFGKIRNQTVVTPVTVVDPTVNPAV